MLQTVKDKLRETISCDMSFSDFYSKYVSESQDRSLALEIDYFEHMNTLDSIDVLKELSVCMKNLLS